jgi:thioredoxin 2
LESRIGAPIRRNKKRRGYRQGLFLKSGEVHMDQENFIVLCPHCGAKNRIPLKKISSRIRCGKCHQLLASTTIESSQTHPITLTDGNFGTEVLDSTGPVLVDFWAPWCGHCRNLEPVLDQLAGEFGSRIKIAKLNVDENPRVASTYNIRSVPNMLFFKSGKVVDSVAGALPKAELARHIQSILQG